MLAVSNAVSRTLAQSRFAHRFSWLPAKKWMWPNPVAAMLAATSATGAAAPPPGRLDAAGGAAAPLLSSVARASWPQNRACCADQPVHG